MVKPDVVLDATTLIGLERIGLLHLIPELLHRAFVTTAVADEFGDQLPWMTVCDAADQGLLRALEVSVDAGEASAIALAVEKVVESSSMTAKLALWPEKWAWKSPERWACSSKQRSRG